MLLPKYKKGVLSTQDGCGQIAYVAMGRGDRKIVTIPGAGDGLRTVADGVGTIIQSVLD
jgi:hypothetical protein